MTAQILDGKALAASIRNELKDKMESLGVKPVLAVVLAGDDPASALYVRNKQKASAEIGIETRLYQFDENVSQARLEAVIQELNQNEDIDGILVQLPLPAHIDSDRILALIDYHKDVDGFHPFNVGLMISQPARAVMAATPKAVMRLLAQTKLDLAGRKALVIGRSRIVGRPTAELLLQSDCTVTIAHSKSENLEELIRQSDIVVAAAGCAALVKGEQLKKGAVVIDVGINRKDGKLCGDVEFETAFEKASFITPVPGGVGPMTIAMLLENTVEAALRRRG